MQKIADPVLVARGFRHRGRLEYFRTPTQERTERIGFSVYLDRTGAARASFGVGIRFPSAERFRLESQDARAATVGVPMHFLFLDRKYFDWTIVESTDLVSLEKDVRLALDRAEVFLSAYSSLEAVAAALESPEPRSWFTFDAAGRLETLALLDCARGHPEKAIQRLEAALGEPAFELEKERAPLARLKDHLSASKNG